MDEKTIYRLNDLISFRKCDLFGGQKRTLGDCTAFGEVEESFRTYYFCNQHGIHLHCTKHPEIEFNLEYEHPNIVLICPKCNQKIEIDDFQKILKQCLKMINIEKFKGAKLIRLDDWYVPEVKKKESINSEYWITTDVKTDKDGDTIIIVYVGHKGTKEKAQFFIKPEKCQLTSDHKDLDPATVLSKIVVTLKDRTLGQKYD